MSLLCIDENGAGILHIETVEVDCVAGIIVPWKTGVFWGNQAGGTCCNHPSVEGFFLPLPGRWIDWSADGTPSFNPIEDACWTGVEAEGRVLVKAFLGANEQLTYSFEPGSDCSDAQEAWLPVRVKSTAGYWPEWIVGRDVILVFPNSD